MNKQTITFFLLLISLSMQLITASETYLSFKADEEVRNGKHIVLIAGDEEYRSEESMPMMAQILVKHGFDCTVLFSMDKNNEFVDPKNNGHLSNPEALNSADLIMIAIRFRFWEDAAMSKFVAAFERGVPIIALRTSTHAFKFPAKTKYSKYGWKTTKEEGWQGGFGRQVLGETWVNHHGRHAIQGTRGIIEETNKDHEILKDVGVFFGPSDVYGAHPDETATILVRGQVTTSLDPDSPAVEGEKNNPMMPIIWIREYKHESGITNKILTSTIGAATDLADANLRRLLINGVYWGVDLEVPDNVDPSTIGEFKPTMFKVGKHQTNMKPSDFLTQ